LAHIEINKKEFDELVGEEISEEKLREEASLLGAHWSHVEGDKWDVEVYPNRPDLLSVEGLARAYRGFFEVDEGLERYQVGKGDLEVGIDESVEDVRPYIGGAVVRDLELSERIINGLIQLQEKMHETLGRRRDKLAIGLHDLSTVDAPFTYKAVEPEKVSFAPLEYDREMELGEILDEHEKGQKYSWILEDEDKYPIIEDSEGRVLSFPPIINNQLTEVDSGTTDIFIDVTGKDEQTVKKALNILTTALAERGGNVESVNVDGETMPDLSPEEIELDLDYLKDVAGVYWTPKEAVFRLEKMKFGGRKGDEELEIKVPCYRNDVMHQYDLIEDVVIAHRYDNIEPTLPEIDQIADQKDIEELTDLTREISVGTGALEANTFILSSKDKLFGMMEKPEEDIVEMSNALTEDYAAVRNWMLPSMLEVLEQNKHHSYPQKFFEAEDVAVVDDSATGSSNKRKLSYVVSDNKVDFTQARETLQVLERDLGVKFEIKPDEKEFFSANRSADIFFNGNKIGFIGEISEQVRQNWELEMPVAAFEIDLDKLKKST
jgi:phenylalanyl-tRNA synthetase beta chain